MAIGDVSLTSSMQANLISLQNTANLLGTTEERLSTGKRVNTAVDNPANFFAAYGETQRANLLTGIKDNISEAIQTVKSADSGIKGILSLIESLRGIVTQARTALNDSVNSATILGGQSAASGASGLTQQYNSLVQQLNNIVHDASYKGTNFLSGNVTLTVNLNENATTKLVMKGFDGSASGLGVSGGSETGYGTISFVNLASGGGANLNLIENKLNKAIATLQTQESQLASNLSTLTTRNTFITDMVNNLSVGSTNLTQADTNLESANLLSLQTKNQLGTTALSISNQAQQAVLRLF